MLNHHHRITFVLTSTATVTLNNPSDYRTDGLYRTVRLTGYRTIGVTDEWTKVRVRVKGMIWPFSPIVRCIIMCNPIFSTVDTRKAVHTGKPNAPRMHTLPVK